MHYANTEAIMSHPLPERSQWRYAHQVHTDRTRVGGRRVHRAGETFPGSVECTVTEILKCYHNAEHMTLRV